MSVGDLTVKQLKELVRVGFAWPGGYTIVFITSDGEVLCRSCVKKEWRQILYSMRHHLTDGWRVVGYALLEAGETEICAHCGKELE